MDLWIYDVGDDVRPEDIERGCLAAESLIDSRGFTTEQAYAAVLARSNGERFDANAARAWDDAEDAALGAMFGDIDDWPDEAVLGPA